MRMRYLALLPIGLLIGCSATPPLESVTDAHDMSFIASDALKNSGFPISNAVEVDGWVFLSGALGTSPGKGLVPGGIKPETRQTMENIQSQLADIGLGMDRVVKCTVMLANMTEWREFNSVYKTFFDGNFPARSAFGSTALALDARVEVECIARR